MTIPAHLLSGAATIMPSDSDLSELRQLCQQWYELQVEIEALETKLSELKRESLNIQMRDLPTRFSEVGTDRIGLPEAEVDVVVRPYVKASISSEWPQDRQNRAFSYLEEQGHGGVIRTTVSVEFGAGEIELARELQQLIQTRFRAANSHPVNIKMGVHWGTLTSLVREQIEAGSMLDLEIIGATVGSAAKILKRKNK